MLFVLKVGRSETPRNPGGKSSRQRETSQNSSENYRNPSGRKGRTSGTIHQKFNESAARETTIARQIAPEFRRPRGNPATIGRQIARSAAPRRQKSRGNSSENPADNGRAKPTKIPAKIQPKSERKNPSEIQRIQRSSTRDHNCTADCPGDEFRRPRGNPATIVRQIAPETQN